jgi:hypothetical protein
LKSNQGKCPQAACGKTGVTRKSIKQFEDNSSSKKKKNEFTQKFFGSSQAL